MLARTVEAENGLIARLGRSLAFCVSTSLSTSIRRVASAIGIVVLVFVPRLSRTGLRKRDYLRNQDGAVAVGRGAVHSVFCVNRVIVFGPHGYPITAFGRTVLEPVHYRSPNSIHLPILLRTIRWLWSYWASLWTNRRNVNRSPVRNSLPIAAHLVPRVEGPNGPTYGHFFLEQLPQVIAYRDYALAHGVDFPLLVNPNFRDWQKALVEIASGRAWEYRPMNGNATHLGLLLCSLVRHVHSRDPEVDPAVLCSLRESIRKNIFGDAMSGRDRAIFDLRTGQSTRTLTNDADIRTSLKGAGLIDAELGRHSWSTIQHLRTVANASAAVFVFGSAIANAVLMEPGSRVVVITGRETKALNVWRQLLSAADLDWHEVEAQTRPDSGWCMGQNAHMRVGVQWHVNPTDVLSALHR